MEDFVYYNNLFDIYSDLLTDNERDNFQDYYQEDLSLSEIADEKNVSRSAIQKTIKNVIDKLNYYEEKLHIYKKNMKISELLDSNDIEQLKSDIREVLGI
ncbi:MAG: HTH domain-containing protein [Bacilli bacterium]|nr:HTH domain-containing protein [Bacilli bacterium]